MFITRFFERQAEKVREMKRQKGYAWAAYQLLSKRMTPVELKYECNIRDISRELWFDFGAHAACRDYIELLRSRL